MIVTINNISDWQNKKVLVREDLNVPQNDTGNITDDTRIQAALPTITHLTRHGAAVILISHLGRPKGNIVPSLTLKPVAERLQKLLPDTPVQFIPDTTWDSIRQQASLCKAGTVTVLENIRFYPEEEKNDPDFARQLAQLADLFVNDAFGTSHRAHASTEGITKFLPSVAGFLMQKEIEALSTVLNSDQPITAIIGGSKVSTKITVLENLLPKVKHLIIGGGMVFTFLKAQGIQVGNSLVEDDFVPLANKLLTQASSPNHADIILPTDLIVADQFSAGANSKAVSINAIPEDWMGLDIGQESIKKIITTLENSSIVLWNGPLGVFEFPKFAEGTQTIANALAKLTQEKPGHFQSILGGGDTVASIEQFKISASNFTHVSTGGGASLEFLEGKTLPGVAALSNPESSLAPHS